MQVSGRGASRIWRRWQDHQFVARLLKLNLAFWAAVWVVLFGLQEWVLAQGAVPAPGQPAESAEAPVKAAADAIMDAPAAESLFSNFDASVALHVLLITLLAVVVVGGSLVVVNFAMMSKRPEDHVGHRDPSDVALLRSVAWPPEPYEGWALPAAEEDWDNRANSRNLPLHKRRLVPEYQPKEVVFVGSRGEESVTTTGRPISEVRKERDRAA